MFELDCLTLKGFRCFENQTFNFKKGINILVGANAVGKTSTVEAVHYLSFAKSFRTSKDQELINNKQKNFYIKAKFSNNDVIEVAYDGEKKLLSFNNQPLKSISRIVGYYNVVVFSPDDLNMIKLDPKLRRRYIDTVLCQTDADYFKALSNIKRIYKEKSAYLHKVREEDVDKKYVETLNVEFSKNSLYIIRKREEFISDINAIFKDVVKEIGNEDTVELGYNANVQAEDIEKKAIDAFLIDIHAKTTTWGPFRDDLIIKYNNSLAQQIASQGQLRTIAIGMRIAVLEYLKRKEKNVAVVLDDVLSELDKERQNKLVSMLKGDVQVFITSTDTSLVDKELLEMCNIINL